MKSPSNRTIGNALREHLARPQVSSPEAFWERFRARASLVPQTGAAGEKVGWRLPVKGLYAAAAAAVALVVSLAVVREPAPGPVSRLSQVSELDVYMDHSSVMIVEDAENRGTVIWLASATLGNGG